MGKHDVVERLPGWESRSLVLSPDLPLAQVEGPGSTSVSTGPMALDCSQEGMATCTRSSFCEMTVRFMGEERSPGGGGRGRRAWRRRAGTRGEEGILLTYSFVADLPVGQ